MTHIDSTTMTIRVKVDLTALHKTILQILEAAAPPTFDADYMAAVARARLACYIDDRAKVHARGFQVHCRIGEMRMAFERMTASTTNAGIGFSGYTKAAARAEVDKLLFSMFADQGAL